MISWGTSRELSVMLETITELSEDVVKSEALLALLIYKYARISQTPVDILYTVCPSIKNNSKLYPAEAAE